MNTLTFHRAFKFIHTHSLQSAGPSDSYLGLLPFLKRDPDQLRCRPQKNQCVDRNILNGVKGDRKACSSPDEMLRSAQDDRGRNSPKKLKNRTVILSGAKNRVLKADTLRESHIPPASRRAGSHYLPATRQCCGTILSIAHFQRVLPPLSSRHTPKTSDRVRIFGSPNFTR